MIRKFLLADDDADDAALFCEALAEIDPAILCYCAADGKEVLDILHNKEFEEPQVIFLDINMPGMNGWECLTRLKGEDAYKHIPVIMYSTSSHQRDADFALELGALCYFTKPSDFDLLKRILRIIAENSDGDILSAVRKFEDLKSHKLFSCT